MESLYMHRNTPLPSLFGEGSHGYPAQAKVISQHRSSHIVGAMSDHNTVAKQSCMRLALRQMGDASSLECRATRSTNNIDSPFFQSVEAQDETCHAVYSCVIPLLARRRGEGDAHITNEKQTRRRAVGATQC